MPGISVRSGIKEWKKNWCDNLENGHELFEICINKMFFLCKFSVTCFHRVFDVFWGLTLKLRVSVLNVIAFLKPYGLAQPAHGSSKLIIDTYINYLFIVQLAMIKEWISKLKRKLKLNSQEVVFV